MEFEKIDILDLLPQRPPFVLIDRLVHFDEHRTVTRFTVPEGTSSVRRDACRPPG